MAAIVVCLIVSACKFDPPEDVPGDGDLEIDATAIDGTPVDAAPCEPDTITCDPDTDRYVECSSSGAPIVDEPCPLGCASDEPRCLRMDPSNGLASYLDLAPTMGDDVVVAAGVTWAVNTTDGSVMAGTTAVDLPHAEFNGMRVYIFRSLDVQGTIKVTGDKPVALVSSGNVTVTGLIDVSADRAAAGPGAAVQSLCGGGESPSGGPGAGGAGRYDGGGAGGDTSTDDGLQGGPMLRDPDLVPLQGGCRGGCVGCISLPLCSNCCVGGAGGGAIQIVSGTSIVVSDNGKIDASGGGGRSGSNGAGARVSGGGGGSGGAILLEATAITLDGPGVVISTKGGSGAAAGDGSANHQGQDGGTGAGAAMGGFNANGAAGGNGGTESVPPTPGGSGAIIGGGGGGGGGSVGEARFNVAAGTVTPLNGAAVRSRLTLGAIGVR